MARGNRLSKKVRWIQTPSFNRTSGRLYFRTEDKAGFIREYSVKGKNVSYWLNHILNTTDTVYIEHIT